MTSTATPPADTGEAEKKKAAKGKGKSETRTYKVLKEVVEGGGDEAEQISFVPVADIVAVSDGAAIKEAARRYGNDNYVAVAASAWHRRSPKIETKEVVTWS